MKYITSSYHQLQSSSSSSSSNFFIRKWIKIALLYSTILIHSSSAFSTSGSSSSSINPSFTRPVKTCRQLKMSTVMDVPSSSSSISFGRRMRDLVFRRNNARRKKTTTTTTTTPNDVNGDGSRTTVTTTTTDVTIAPRRSNNSRRRPSNVFVVNDLDEYKKVVADEKDKLIVVRFYATWCKACKAIGPSFYRLAQIYPDIIFAEVPVSQKNINLHQGLGVSSLPFGHIYHPTVGLVEELKMSKKYFSNFAKVLQSYAYGSCDLYDGESSSPYKVVAISSREADSRVAE